MSDIDRREIEISIAQFRFPRPRSNPTCSLCDSFPALTFLTIQPLTLDLLPPVVELDRRCFGGLWTLDGYQRELDSPNSDLLVLSVLPEPILDREKGDGNLPHLAPSPPHSLIGLGCLWSIVEEAHITLLAIEPNYRQQGLGSALFCALLVAALQRGLERATLELRVSNQAALSLYQKFGFQEAGRRRRYYPDNGEDALILWRGGLQHPQFKPTLTAWEQEIHHRLRSKGWELRTEPREVIINN